MANSGTKPKRFDRNLIVIGAGSAGLVSAYIAAIAQAKVTLIEAHAMGGDCLNTGCVPSKALIKSARVAHMVSDAARFGIKTSTPTIDFPVVMQRIREVITAIEPHDSVERFTGLGVDCMKGYARFIDPWTVEIDGKTRLTAQSFVIATGAAPLIPPLPGVEASGYLTSETLWDEFAKRPAAPKRLVILGGGPIGCELAQSFQRLGSQVTLVEMAERLLLKEEADAAALVTEHLHADGVEILTGHKAVRFETNKCLIVEGSQGERTLAYDDVLIAVGRKPRIAGFGLEELGLVIDGKLPVDGFLRTNMPHILCAGDVAGKQQLTHGGSHEAWYASVNALARPFKKYRADYRVLPRVTYTEPELAAVGLTEVEATRQGVAFDVTRYDLDDLDRAIAEGEQAGFVKILTATGSDRILGATIIGEHAGEILAEITFAMKHQLGLRKILATIHPYPTWSEATKYAAGQYGLARKPLALLKWAERWFRWRRG
ncbi:dihydrolipoyl dehydrogenase family protein [Sphingorhabdus profundilacus]|uniref:dihydrolipoyl dehydrogenase family protein n=1 Tax=Sphingorhabdus profundilacus TaxID=2509718 RepID=UPI0031B5C7CC